jgi:hypothetical protein
MESEDVVAIKHINMYDMTTYNKIGNGNQGKGKLGS